MAKKQSKLAPQWFLKSIAGFGIAEYILIYRHLRDTLKDSKWLRNHQEFNVIPYSNPANSPSGAASQLHGQAAELTRRALRVFSRQNNLNYLMRVYNDNVTMTLMSKDICLLTKEPKFERDLKDSVWQQGVEITTNVNKSHTCEGDCSGCVDYKRRQIKIYSRGVKSYAPNNSGWGSYGYTQYLTSNMQTPLSTVVKLILPSIIKFVESNYEKRAPIARAHVYKENFIITTIRDSVVASLDKMVTDGYLNSYSGVAVSRYYSDIWDATVQSLDYGPRYTGTYQLPTFHVKVPQGCSVQVRFSWQYVNNKQVEIVPLDLPIWVTDVLNEKPAPAPTVVAATPVANPLQEQLNAQLQALQGGNNNE